MSKFLMVFRGGLEIEKSFTEQRMQDYMQEWFGWIEKMKNKGIFLDGEPVEESGVTIRGKDKLVADTPYATGKDLVGGYVIVEMANFQAAQTEALNCPIYQTDGSVELRQVRDMSGLM